MYLRCLLGTSLLAFSALVPAQQQPPVKPAPQQPKAEVKTAEALPPLLAPAGAQDPEKRDPKIATPEERLKQLQNEKARLEQEMQYVSERANKGWMVQMLQQKLAARKLELKSIDAGISAGVVQPAAPDALKPTAFKRARIMQAEESSKLPADVLMVIAGMPVTKTAIDQMVGYLDSYMTVGAPEMRQNQAMFAIVQTEVAGAAFAKSAEPAKARADALAKEIQGGANFADLAKQNSPAQGADQANAAEKFTRRSHHGLCVEYYAFNTPEGGVSPVFRSPLGYNLLKVEKIEKGASKDLDTVMARLITVPYDADLAKVRQAQSAVATGQIEIAVKDEAAMKLLPPMFRPVEAAPAPAGAKEIKEFKDDGSTDADAVKPGETQKKVEPAKKK